MLECVYIYTHVHIQMQNCVHVCAHTLMNTYMYACIMVMGLHTTKTSYNIMYIYIMSYTVYIYVYIYTYIYICI